MVRMQFVWSLRDFGIGMLKCPDVTGENLPSWAWFLSQPIYSSRFRSVFICDAANVEKSALMNLSYIRRRLGALFIGAA